MDTRQLQNEQRQIALWKVLLWSSIPFMVLLLFASGVYNAITKVERQKLLSIEASRDTVLLQLAAQTQQYENLKSDLSVLLQDWKAMDTFTGAQRSKFLRFAPHQRTQLETEIQLYEGEYDILRQEMSRTLLKDTLTVKLKRMILQYSALCWSQVKHEALSDSEDLQLLKQQVDDKDGEIRELMNQQMLSLKLGAQSGIKPSCTEPAVKEKPELTRLTREIEDLKRQAIAHDYEQRKECHNTQIQIYTEFRDKLKELLNGKRKLDSLLVPEIKDLIKEFNHNITKMRASKV